MDGTLIVGRMKAEEVLVQDFAAQVKIALFELKKDDRIFVFDHPFFHLFFNFKPSRKITTT